MLQSEEVVRQTIEQHQATFWAIFDSALDELVALRDWRMKERKEPLLYSRTESNYIFDAIARTGRAMFSDVEDVEVVEEAQSVKFCFGDIAVVRLKKCGPNGIGQNIPTQAVLNFNDPQMTLPGLPPAAARIEIVWQSDELGLNIEKLIVNARHGNDVDWSFALTRPVEDTRVITLPVHDDPDTDEPLIKPIRRVEADKLKD
ncbi:MAG: hypothetical protein ACSHXW_10330 [Yoonia sp.]